MGSLSLRERMALIWYLVGLLPYVASRVIWTNVLHKSPVRGWKRAVHDSGLHYLSSYMTIRQWQNVVQPTRTAFNQFVTTNKLPYSEEQIEQGASLRWIGNKSVGKTLLYLPGGGYTFPLSPFHLDFLRYVQREYEHTRGAPLNVAVLEYSLAPHHQFPTQLRQATSALLHLLSSGIAPGNIIVGGDSAGGHLCLVLASHILQPCSEVEQIKLSAPLAGILLISPTVSRDPSDIPTRSKDVLCPVMYARMWAAMPIDKSPNAWRGREALYAPEGWWASLNTIVRRVLLTSGEDEALYATMDTFGRILGTEAAGVEVEILSEPGVPHINPIIDASRLGDGPGLGSKRIVSWIGDI